MNFDIEWEEIETHHIGFRTIGGKRQLAALINKKAVEVLKKQLGDQRERTANRDDSA